MKWINGLIVVMMLALPTAFLRAADALAHEASPATTQASTAPAEKPATLQLIQHLQSTLSKVESIQSDFVQTKKLAVLNHTLTIKGRFALQKPDRVIWIVDEPVKYAIRVEGEEIRQWDEDTNKVQVMHLGGDPTFKAITQQIQAWFLGDYESLAKQYAVYVVSEKPLSLRFEPKGDSMVAKLVKDIQVTFAANEMNVDEMIVRETGGDQTTLHFLNTRLNEPVKPQTWEIPPK